MRFREWLQNENAHRTGTRAYNYPPQYDTHGFADWDFPLIHMSLSADMLAYLAMKPVKYHWKNFDKTQE